MEFEETQNRIVEVLGGIQDLLLYKNAQYGNIGSDPINIFARYMSRGNTAINGILQRLDDKLARIKNCPEEKPRANDICDLVGYLCLLAVNLGISKEDIAKFKD